MFRPQVLELDPSNELVFKGPFKDVVTSHLYLQNPTEKIVLFRVKTTAPKHYCVRPNNGVLDPHSIQDIAVMLQPDDTAASERNKHKFMVQSIFAPPNFSPEQFDTVWKSTPRSQFMDSKLTCLFVEEEPDEHTVTQSTPAPAPEDSMYGCEDGTRQETRYFTLHKEQEHHEQEYSVLLQQKQISEEQCSLLKQQLSQQSQASQKIQEELECQLQKVSEQHQQRILLIQEEQHHLQEECTILQQQVVQQREAAVQAEVRYHQEIEDLQRRLDTALAEMQQLRPSSRTQVLVEDIDPWKVSRDEVQIMSEMDRGAWGYVAKGRFRGQLVAVKSPHLVILDEHTTKRLQREVRIMTQVRHPNLLRIIAAVFDNQVPRLPPLIVTELLDMNLRSAYKNNRLTGATRIPIFQDVAYALHYLHEHQEPIIHRDVSAPNVLLEVLPNGMFRAKVSDFGSANLAKLAQTLAEGAIIYAAPETFPHDPHSPPPPQTTKIDVYSYGVLLCEVITCQLPDPQRFWSVLKQIESQWPFMHELIVFCTKRSPEDRLTMTQVLDKLNQLPNFVKDLENIPY